MNEIVFIIVGVLTLTGLLILYGYLIWYLNLIYGDEEKDEEYKTGERE